MALDALTFHRWRSLDRATARRITQEAADRAGGRLVRIDTVEHLGAPLHRAQIDRDGRVFALIPGGTVRLGFDLDTWEPTAGQLADYASSHSQGYGSDPDLKLHLAEILSPPRTVHVPTVLMAVEDEPLTEAPADMPQALEAHGLRMPSRDEWEHACGAGATTLFRWGDDCPLNRIPYGPEAGPHREPNAFGLRIACDTYRAELSSDTSAMHGGDGGESVCGGYGMLLAWLPLATANRNPALAELVHGPEGEDLYDDFSVRPVVSLG
jgi:hypothetical protein